MTHSNDEDLFRQAMADVEPLEKEKRVNVTRKARDDASARRRREAAEETVTPRGDDLTGDYVTPVDPHDLLDFKRPGIQHGVFKKLRLGKYPVEAQLDLHRMKVDPARRAVAQFIKDCVAQDIRCALINHGKGANRQPQPALMKSCVAHWLPQLDAVMAFHSAQKHHGGAGATYVLLKKSDKKRRENLEKHQKRR